MVIFTAATTLRFQSGSVMALANRVTSRFRVASLPMKWSIRKIADSAKWAWSVAFSSTADWWSRPNGFSMMSRAPSSRPTPAMPVATAPNSDGGMARWKIGWAASPASAFSFSKVAGSA